MSGRNFIYSLGIESIVTTTKTGLGGTPVRMCELRLF